MKKSLFPLYYNVITHIHKRTIFDVKGNFVHPQQILADRAVCRETKMEFSD
jgi:hypothetical protein